MRPSTKTQIERRTESVEKLIRVGFMVVARNGLRSLSLSAVGEDAGCSRELPRYIFGSKEAFVLALLEDCRLQWDRVLALPDKKGMAGKDALLLLLDRFAEMYVRGDTKIMHGRMRLIFELAGDAESVFGKKLLAIQAAAKKQLTSVMRTGISNGDFLDSVDVNSMATLLNCCYRGIGYQWVTNPKAIDLDATLAQMREMVLRTLTTPPAISPNRHKHQKQLHAA